MSYTTTELRDYNRSDTDAMLSWCADEIHRLNEELYCVRNSQSIELFAAKEEINRLREYIINDALCPCCGQTQKCIDECTYEEDVGTYSECFQRMLAARSVMYPESD